MTSSDIAIEILRNRVGSDPIDTMVVLGLGLGQGFESLMTDAVCVPFAELPGFPDDVGAGRVLVGCLDDMRIAACIGRSPYYATGNMRGAAAAFETLAMMGVRKALLTGSVLSINADIPPGTLVLISDHINMSGANPLIGLGFTEDFLALTDAYDAHFAKRLRRAALLAGVALREGVYLAVGGATFETPAEIKVARAYGADVVGKTLIPETIIARRYGMRVGGVVIATGFGAGFLNGAPTHSQVREMTRSGSIPLKRLLRSFLKLRGAEPAFTRDL